MKQLTTLSAAAILCSLFVPSSVRARKVEIWEYDRLLKEADLVVIGIPQGDAPGRHQWSEQVFDQNRFEGVVTTFGIKAVLKGKAPVRIHMIHFRYRPGAVVYHDGPGLVSFAMKPVRIEVGPAPQHRTKLRDRLNTLRLTSEPEYLLFLRQRRDGRYEAVSGQMDPDFSVRALFQTDALLQTGVQR